MPHADRSRLMMLITVAVLTLCGGGAYTQDEVEPTNDLPNPYQTTAPWGNLPDRRMWGALNAVAIDNDGESVWVADRCGANPDTPPGASAFQYDSCAGSTAAPILKFDSSGNLLKSFGAGMFIFPHKIYVDRDGNLWVADQRSANERELAKFPGEKEKGHVVVKFSPDGKVLLTLGKRGMAGNPPDALTQPTGKWDGGSTTLTEVRRSHREPLAAALRQVRSHPMVKRSSAVEVKAGLQLRAQC